MSGLEARTLGSRRGWVVVVALGAVLAGTCGERSLLDADARIVVSGSVRAPDGSPLAARPVRTGGGAGTGEGLVADLMLEKAETVAAWRASLPSGTATVDGRRLEYTSGRVVMAGSSDDRVEGSDLTRRRQAPGVPHVAGPGRRRLGAGRCRFVDASGGRCADGWLPGDRRRPHGEAHSRR